MARMPPLREPMQTLICGVTACCKLSFALIPRQDGGQTLTRESTSDGRLSHADSFSNPYDRERSLLTKFLPSAAASTAGIKSVAAADFTT